MFISAGLHRPFHRPLVFLFLDFLTLIVLFFAFTKSNIDFEELGLGEMNIQWNDRKMLLLRLLPYFKDLFFMQQEFSRAGL